MELSLIDQLGLKVGKKKRINTKAKGSQFERIVADILGKWAGMEFTRVPSSGGIGWKDGNVDLIGDITPKDRTQSFVFTVECKASKKIIQPTFGRLYKSAQMQKFMEQAAKEAVHAGKYPLLIVKADGMRKKDYLVGISTELLKLLSNIKEEDYSLALCGHPIEKNQQMSFAILTLDKFFDTTYQEIKDKINLLFV
jgi:Holliday junction resolvase